MTEREKMVSGELYDPTDKELEQFLISPAWMLSLIHICTGTESENRNCRYPGHFLAGNFPSWKKHHE